MKDFEKKYGSKAEVFHGTAEKTRGELIKKDIVQINDGYDNFRYKSKKQQKAGKKKGTFRDAWAKAMKKARKELVNEGIIDSGEFVPVGGKSKEGKALLKRTKELIV
jgi:hypothetical protein